MRVLHVTHYYERVGGAEVHIHSLADELRQRGHTVGFFAGSTETELDTPEARVVKRPYFPHANMLRDDKLCGEFLRFARAFQPDLIHLHKLVAFPVEILLAMRACRVPLLKSIYDYSLFCPNGWCVWPDGTVCAGGPGRKCFQHGCETNHRYDARVVLVTHMRFRLMRRLMDAYVCPTEHLSEMCRSHAFRGVHTLPYYPPHDGSKPRPNPAPAATLDPDRVLCISRLEKEKGVSTLVEAFAVLRERRPSARLSIVGGGPEEGRLRARAQELGLDSTIDFHGPVPLDELPGHLARAAVLVMPSIWCEALPLIAFDALAAGLPMIGSDIGGIPTIVREGITGLLARPRDPADFAEKIARILADGGLRARLAEGCRADLARYSRGHHMDRLEEIYAETRGIRRVPRDPGPSVLGGERRSILDRLLVRYDELETELAKEGLWVRELQKGYLERIAWLERDGEAAKASAQASVAHSQMLAERIEQLKQMIEHMKEATPRRRLERRMAPLVKKLARLKSLLGLGQLLK